MVTFPFLFGLMFGDFGHGSILFLFGSVITLFNNQFKGTFVEVILPYRYFFLLLGFMASYCGIIYNEFFALPMNLFSSCYTVSNKQMWEPTLDEEGKIEGDWTYLRVNHDCNVAVGFDPVWNLSTAKLMFQNNVKMKLSVIVGVIHMSIGIIIKGTNAVYFSKWPVLFTEVFTGLIILLGLFGWMDFLFYAKWFKHLDIEDKTLMNKDDLYDKLNQDDTATPEYKGDYYNRRTPSVINIMITTIFNGGKYPEQENEYVALVGDTQEEQYQVALSLLIIAVTLIPVMLLVKPCFFSGAA